MTVTVERVSDLLRPDGWSSTTTRRPADANRWQTAAPIAPAPPVTTTTCFEATTVVGGYELPAVGETLPEANELEDDRSLGIRASLASW
jgi:hypothetical protein